MQMDPEQTKALEKIAAFICEVRRCREPLHYRIVQQRLSRYIEFLHEDYKSPPFVIKACTSGKLDEVE